MQRRPSALLRSSLPLAIAAGLLAAACAARPAPVLYPEVQRGPAAGASPRKVLVLTASCGSMEYRCPREHTDTVDGIVRNALDLAGYALVAAETLRHHTRQRHETHEHERTTDQASSSSHDERTLAPDRRFHSEQASVTERQSSVVVLDGPGFEDLTVAERRQVIAEAGADAVVTVRVVVGASTGVWSPNQTAEVLVKLALDGGETMAWAARCQASSNDFASVTAALEHATRCAMRGATGR
jgi:hypothetical protein